MGERRHEISYKDETGSVLEPISQGSGEEGDTGRASPPYSQNSSVSPSTSSSPPVATPEFSEGDPEEIDCMKYLQQEAAKILACVQEISMEGNTFTCNNGHHAAALPLTHKAALHWFYVDTEGKIQGPFCREEMEEWYEAQYFNMSMLVKRGCDEGFRPLGEIVKICGKDPFDSGVFFPPLLENSDYERLQELAQSHQLQPHHLRHILKRSRCSSVEESEDYSHQQRELSRLLQQMDPSSRRILPPWLR